MWRGVTPANIKNGETAHLTMNRWETFNIQLSTLKECFKCERALEFEQKETKRTKGR